MKERGDGYFQVSLMNVFRRAAESRDAQGSSDSNDAGSDRVLSSRSIERRDGSDEIQLRANLAADLSSLLETINLEAVEDLRDLDHVKRSILNYGIQDMARFSTSDIESARFLRDLRTALINHEPRLIPGSVDVRLRSSVEDSRQRAAIAISAEMTAHPVDVPLEFVAELDVGTGKMSLSEKVVRQ
jgi:type VI secretion system protein ImpF